MTHGLNKTYFGLVRVRKISEFKAHISQDLAAVRRGERIVILDRDIPVAQVIPHPGEETPLVARSPTRPLEYRKLGISVSRDPLEVLSEERGGR